MADNAGLIGPWRARGFLTRWVGLCIVGVILLALGADVPVLHQHHAATPTWYDETCSLDRLAISRLGLPPEDPAPAPSRLLAGDGVVLPELPPSGPGAPRQAPARAPPVAS
jgi:hypothetical protein